MTDILIIGYGNELRGDDGLGPFVAKSVAAANLPGVRVATAVQLLPELAADIVEARVVVFVDAAVEPSEIGVFVRPLAAVDRTDWCPHRGDPRALLALTQAVYGQAPEAWWLTIRGWNFAFGEGLSGKARENARQALVRLQRWIK